MASPWVVGVKIARRKLKKILGKSRRVEKLLKDSFSMDSGVKVEGKKSKRYEDN